MKTYNQSVGNGIPENIIMPSGKIDLHPSMHSEEQARDKGFKIPSQINVTRQNIVEVYMKNSSTMEKCLIRFPYDAKTDMSVIVKPNDGFVITSWLNSKNDNHSTINKNKYHS